MFGLTCTMDVRGEGLIKQYRKGWLLPRTAGCMYARSTGDETRWRGKRGSRDLVGVVTISTGATDR